MALLLEKKICVPRVLVQIYYLIKARAWAKARPGPGQRWGFGLAHVLRKPKPPLGQAKARAFGPSQARTTLDQTNDK